MLSVASKIKIKLGCFTVLSFRFLFMSTLKHLQKPEAVRSPKWMEAMNPSSPKDRKLHHFF